MYQREIIMLGVGSRRELRPRGGVEGGLLIGGHGNGGWVMSGAVLWNMDEKARAFARGRGVFVCQSGFCRALSVKRGVGMSGFSDSSDRKSFEV
jgi:hypothetical protein